MTEGVDANKSAMALAAGGTGGRGRSGSAVAMIRNGRGATLGALLFYLFIPDLDSTLANLSWLLQAYCLFQVGPSLISFSCSS